MRIEPGTKVTQKTRLWIPNTELACTTPEEAIKLGDRMVAMGKLGEYKVYLETVITTVIEIPVVR